VRAIPAIELALEEQLSLETLTLYGTIDPTGSGSAMLLDGINNATRALNWPSSALTAESGAEGSRWAWSACPGSQKKSVLFPARRVFSHCVH
jgi:hypothetical protein